MVILVKLILLITCIASKFVVALLQDDACSVISSRCGGIDIRFPFHLTENKDKQLQPNNCVFPSGFELSCNNNYDYLHRPVLKFDYKVNTSVPGLYLSLTVAYVDSIDYKSQKLNFHYLSTNIKQHYDHHYFSNSPFKPFTVKESDPYGTPYLLDYTFYKCSSTTCPYINRPTSFLDFEHVPSLSDDSFQVFAVNSHLGTEEAPLECCTKLYNISNVPLFRGGLSWSKPDCGYCEDKGQYCKFKPNSTTLTQCFPIPKGPSSNKLQVTGRVVEIFGATLIFVALFYAIYSYKLKKDYHHKIETFLEDYKALKPTRCSYADIKKITNYFKVRLGEGGYGSVFKGQLSNDVEVAVKVLNDKVDGSGEDFINEVSTIGLVHHVNVVRLVGFCADGCRRALVYEFLPNNSLEKFVYSKENHGNKFLGWVKMQEIALGIAKGIEYLHQGCAQRILHFDIKPHNILLDQNFNPKISDFGLAKLCTKGQSIVSMTMARGTIGYIAPEVYSRNFGKVSAKSDVYSFGMLLLEMVGAKNHKSVGTESTGEVYFPEWIFNQLEQQRETKSEIEKDNDRKIERKLTIVGLWCINWHPADRPSMKNVIQMLQGEDCPSIPPNPFSSTSSRSAFAAVPSRAFINELDAISESE